VSRRFQSYDAVIAAPFGLVGIRMRGDGLAAIELKPRIRRITPPKSEAAAKAAEILSRYFKNPACTPSLKLEISGTPFQRRVWQALTRIPPASTVTYGGLAEKLGTSARAVGGACRENPVPVVVPCHRVIAANGTSGFMGRSGGCELDIKTWLLCHEAQLLSGDCDQRI
jgi:methylated-DNA-[protein]-cysteine S-methyltransferase